MQQYLLQIGLVLCIYDRGAFLGFILILHMHTDMLPQVAQWPTSLYFRSVGQLLKTHSAHLTITGTFRMSLWA